MQTMNITLPNDLAFRAIVYTEEMLQDDIAFADKMC